MTNPRGAGRIEWGGRLTLLEMIQFYAASYFFLARLLAHFEEAAGRRVGGGIVPQESVNEMRENIEQARTHCVVAGLDMSCRAIDRLLEQLKINPVPEDRLHERVSYLSQVMEDELRQMAIFQVPREKVHYLSWKNGKYAQHFGEQVETNFPNARFDILQAGDCLAASLDTACVLHLVRVIDLGLKALAADLGITLDLDRTWKPTLRTIRDRITELDKAGTIGDRKPFYDDLVGHLYAIQNAWRHPAVHGAVRYDYNEARPIWNAIDGFMRKLATKVKESA